jgi:uncharacterized repeat protein (TIGR01451 family)
LTWPGATIGGALSGICRPYRAAWLGFGLEGAGPGDVRIELTRRILDWFAAPPDPFGFAVRGPTGPLIGRSGAAFDVDLMVDSLGIMTDTIEVRLEGGPWPAELRLPGGDSISGEGAFELAGCTSAAPRLRVAVPAAAPTDARATYTVTLRSRGDASITRAVALTIKTPAPILFLDDQRWYNYAARYTRTLDSLALAYDVLTSNGGSAPPTADVLMDYKVVVWTTGYDWHEPLSPRDETNLAAFLDHGGRLLLTGQDVLDVTGIDSFVQQRLGVATSLLSVNTGEALSSSGGPLGDDLGPWRLVYPYQNWSDGILPEQSASGVLQDNRQNTVAVAKSAPTWRTMFFAFPLEALDDDARTALLGRAVLWLSPLGESRLQAPAFAAAGGRIPITLTLGLAAETEARADLRARLPLPPGAIVAPGSLRGPWRLEAAENALVWSGSLQPDALLTLGADVELSSSLPAGAHVPLRAHLYAGDGLAVTVDAPVVVDVPWLTLAEQVNPGQASPGETLRYTITVRNVGLLSTTAHLTDTLPAEVALVADSLWASRGLATARPGRVLWSDALEPGAQVQLGFTAALTSTLSGGRVSDWTEITDDRGRRSAAWATVTSPTRRYLPLVLHRSAAP